MVARKIRAFLDTPVITEYLRGKAELRGLFSEEVRERVSFVVNGTVFAELCVAHDETPGGLDLGAVIPYLEIIQTDIRLVSDEMPAFRNRRAHVIDMFILAAARTCDLLLTYDRDLIDASGVHGIRSESPEEFLSELNAAA